MEVLTNDCTLPPHLERDIIPRLRDPKVFRTHEAVLKEPRHVRYSLSSIAWSTEGVKADSLVPLNVQDSPEAL